MKCEQKMWLVSSLHQALQEFQRLQFVPNQKLMAASINIKMAGYRIDETDCMHNSLPLYHSTGLMLRSLRRCASWGLNFYQKEVFCFLFVLG
jgi:hypothetical protein